MTTGLTIRPYAESDLESVIAILRDLFASEGKLYDRTRPASDIGPAYVADLCSEVKKSRGILLVAECDGAVVGYCTLHTHRNTEGDTDETYYEYGHIGDVGVLASHRSRGVGARLIAHCEDIVRSAGIKWIRLNVLAANTRGRRFYESQGFRENMINLEKAL